MLLFVIASVLLVLTIYLFTIVAGCLPFFQPAWQAIKERDVESGGIFYTDMPEAREGGFHIRSYREYAEKQQDKQ